MVERRSTSGEDRRSEARDKADRRNHERRDLATRPEDRALPHSIQAETALLGALIVNATLLTSLPPGFAAEAFYRDAHRRVYAGIVRLADRRMAVDPLTLAEELRRTGELDEVGGAAYLVGLTDGVPRTSNAPHYATIVLGHATRRAVIRLANGILGRAYEATDSPAELLDYLQREVSLVASQETRGGLVLVRDLIPTWVAALDATHGGHPLTVGVPTGYADLDAMTGGLQRGDLILLAARPSLGKTSLAVDIARYIATSGRVAAVFSLEMTKKQILTRMACAAARVDSFRLRNGYLTEGEYRRMSDALAALDGLALAIDDVAGLTPADVRARARRLKAEHGDRLDLIVVDYLQLMRTRERYESRQQQVSAISGALKEAAKELDCPLLALSQLSRPPEGKPRPPQLTDLRESGALEQDADVVVFLWRKADEDEETQLIIGKQRSGPVGTIKLQFLKGYTTFVPCAPDDAGASS